MNAWLNNVMYSAVLITAVYLAWRWLRTNHIRPVLGAALRLLEREFDYSYRNNFANKPDSEMNVGLAKSLLAEIREYKNRLWILGNSWTRRNWEHRLKYREQLCLNILEAAAGRNKAESMAITS